MDETRGTGRELRARTEGRSRRRGRGTRSARAPKRMLWRDIRRTVARSRGRFISIVLLMALGSFALVGLKVAGPDMRATGETYFAAYNASDLTVIADLGLDADDEAAIERAGGIADVEYGYLKDMVVAGTHDAVRVGSAPERISRFEVVEGRLPEAADEIAVSQTLADGHPIGSVIAFDEEPDVSGSYALSSHEFTVVGVVNSSEVVSTVNMGQTQTGTGDLRGLAVVAPEAFGVDYHMVARLRFDDTVGLDPYSQDYLDRVAAHKEELEGLLADRPAARLATVRAQFDERIADGQAQVDEARAALDGAAATLADAATQLADGRARLAAGEDELADAADELAAGQAALDATGGELASARAQLDAGRAELEGSEETLRTAEAQLASARAELAERQAEYDETASTLADAQQRLDDSRAQLEVGRARYDAAVSDLEARLQQAREQLTAARQGAEQAAAAIAEIDAKLAALDAAGTPGAAADVPADPDAAVPGTAVPDAAPDAPDTEALRAELEAKRAELAARLEEAQAAASRLEEAVPQLEAGLSQAQAARDAFLSQDAGTGADGAPDGGYRAVAARLDAAQSELDAQRSGLDAAAGQLAAASARIEEQQRAYDAGCAAYRQGLAAYEAGLADYQAGLEAWRTGAEELAARSGDYRAAASELDAARAELAAREAEYADGLAAYDESLPEAQAQIADAEAELVDAARARDGIERPAYSVYNRRELPGAEGYTIYATISEIVDSLANIFPFFLYFVAALVTFTTMTRMVEEERLGAGTLKALGYDDADVIKKFAFYGAAAGLAGTAVGIACGHTVLPLIVWAAYAHAYTLPVIELHAHAGVTLLAVAFAFIAAVLPAVAAGMRTAREKPSELLVPRAPAAGSTILLERIPAIWHRLSFTHKVTARNLFRYKRRALMTVVGVAGAASLLFCGFAVQHSISGIGERQFGELIGYDLIVAENARVDASGRGQIDGLLSSAEVDDFSAIRYESLAKQAGDKGDTQQITLLVPEDPDSFSAYLTLQNRETGEALSLEGDGAVISERLATLTGVGVGDDFTFTDGDGVERTVRVSGVCEMYVTHFMFMSAQTYRQVFGSDPTTNAYVVKLADDSLGNVEEQAAAFMAADGVSGVVQNVMYINQVNIIVRSLNMIMTILIAIASMLTVVILYNLVTINVSERIRELSTIKVLGFRPREVTMYIYRETILLSAIGVPVGWAIGRWLQLYIITAVPPEETMFNPACGALAFIVPTAVIALVVLALYFAVSRRLARVDMLEALKSVD